MNRATHAPNTQVVVSKQQYTQKEVWDFENDWKTKFCSCKPAGRCCFSCFCSCCMGCKIAKYSGESAVIGCFPCALSYLRTKLRTARRIKGNCCTDCCTTTFCCCVACAQTQLANELETQGLWDPPKTKQPRNPPNDRFNTHHSNDRSNTQHPNDRYNANNRDEY